MPAKIDIKSYKKTQREFAHNLGQHEQIAKSKMDS